MSTVIIKPNLTILVKKPAANQAISLVVDEQKANSVNIGVSTLRPSTPLPVTSTGTNRQFSYPYTAADPYPGFDVVFGWRSAPLGGSRIHISFDMPATLDYMVIDPSAGINWHSDGRIDFVSSGLKMHQSLAFLATFTFV
ncbi:hypothetical protein ABAC460_15825 [Asticcacaulis sp. AC460]|uniref:hypothetical protein n=1 Tax=Asticcacaulis sp. AC460 TaxID=1282360 RepID=UPI0003C40BCF|nr:hypothetical protein [Asticcacaulis sp. AC460]ESQ88499.1 hypothetical protein ABAC460_15825 [Asticcacaulis sp. AC460]